MQNLKNMIQFDKSASEDICKMFDIDQYINSQDLIGIKKENAFFKEGSYLKVINLETKTIKTLKRI